MAPIYKQMAEQYKDKAVFAKVDINANYQTASSQQIRHVASILSHTALRTHASPVGPQPTRRHPSAARAVEDLLQAGGVAA